MYPKNDDRGACCTDCAVKLDRTLRTENPNIHEVGYPDGEAHPAKEKDSENRDLVKKILPLAGLFIVFVLGLVFGETLRRTALGIPEYALFLSIYLIAGWKVLVSAFRNILRGKVFDENFLMTLATLGAIAIRALPEAAGVMLFYAIGQFFEDLALGRSRKSIEALMNIRPDFAFLKTGEGFVKTDPTAVVPGDIILIKAGERVPLDGVVSTGESGIDSSALTGESVPRKVGQGDEVLAGSIVTSGSLTLRVTRAFGESAVSRILNLVEHALNAKAPTEKFITKFARYYTPAVVGAAVLVTVLPTIFLGAGVFKDWLYRALVLLVISCPCALVISIPLAYFAGIGKASRRGILIKGSNHIDSLSRTEAVVFDKTGTLTTGRFELKEIVTRNGYSKEEVLFYAAHGEARSNHPIAAAIRSAYKDKVNDHAVSASEEIAGFGIKATVNGKIVLLGNDRFLHKEAIPHEDCRVRGTLTYAAVNGRYVGYLVIGDTEKPEAAKAIRDLAALGIHRTVMLTGDSADAARETAENLGIGEYHGALLPEDKVEMLKGIRKQSGGSIAFAGDGINDAPVLATADIGIAMGAFGSDAAVETADIVLMTDDPGKIPEAISLAKKTRSVVIQTIVLVLATKAAFISFGAFGIAGLWEAVFADVGVTLLAVLNALRALRGKKVTN